MGIAPLFWQGENIYIPNQYNQREYYGVIVGSIPIGVGDGVVEPVGVGVSDGVGVELELESYLKSDVAVGGWYFGSSL